MKKAIFIPVLYFGLLSACIAQNASESMSLSPMGGNDRCIVVELEGQQKNVEAVLAEKFKNLKSKKTKGFVAYKAQIFPEISANTLDIYYKVETLSENRCKVILFLSTGYSNWLTYDDNAGEIENAKKMLDNLGKEVRTYELKLAVDAQTRVLEDALKGLEKLSKDHARLITEMERLQKEMEANRALQDTNLKTQESQKITIENEKKLLTDLQVELSRTY